MDKSCYGVHAFLYISVVVSEFVGCVWVLVGMCVYLWMCVYMCVCVYRYICICVRICLYVCVCICLYVCVYTFFLSIKVWVP